MVMVQKLVGGVQLLVVVFRAGQRVNLDPKGFSKGSFTGKIQTKRFSKGFFTRKVQTKRFSKGLFAGEIQTKRFSKGFFTGEIQTKRFSKDSRRVEDPVQTPPLPPLWVFMTPSLNMESEIFLSVCYYYATLQL